MPDNNKKVYKASGFTIVETLVVVLVIGILASAAVSSYSGVVDGTRTKSAKDRLETFFRSCKDRAKLRKQDIAIVYDEKAQCLRTIDSTKPFLKVPELYGPSVPKQIDINRNGSFNINGNSVNSLELSLDNPNGNPTRISIDL